MRNPLGAAAAGMRRRGESSGGYYAGAQGRWFYDYVMGTLSANSAMRGSLRQLRNRAREITTRNGHASRVPQLFSENVIGPAGIGYAPAVTAGDGSFDARVNATLDAFWRSWAESPLVSTDRSLCLSEIETQDMENEVVDGETLIRLVDNADTRWGFQLEVLDPDQLDHTYDVEGLPNGHAIVMGVEVDAWGAPVGYWLWKNHPSDKGAGPRTRVDAGDIVHTYLARRPRQRRGVSWFAPTLIDFAMHGGWRENQLIASRAAAGKMGFLEPGENAEPWDDDEDELAEEHGKKVLPSEVIPGGIERLPRGWEFKSHDPSFPSTNYSEFDSSILYSLAVGLRVSHMSLSGNLNKTSYGSGRIGLLAEQAVYKHLQRRRIRRFNNRILERLVQNGLMTGALALPSFDVQRYLACTWHPKPQPWLAPKEDLDVSLAERRACLTSLFDIAAEKGLDLEEQFRKIARERELAERYGITIDLSPTSSAAAPLLGDVPAAAPPAGPGASGLTLIGGG